MRKKNRDFVRWMDTAEENLKSANVNRDEGLYPWACYIAQQAAEAALKAYLLYQGEDLPYVHQIKMLLARCEKYDVDFRHDIERFKNLDNFYISTRYPNALSDGTPGDFYSKYNADVAIELASEIVNLVKGKLPG